MKLGFETIGNATVICHDGGPVLATDPWLSGDAYFGSWILTHAVPQQQLADVRACRYVFLSHGHPDHLSMPSLERLKDKQILLADHVGGRIASELRALGFQVRVLADGVWTQLSDRLRVCAVADCNQDSILLIELGGRLIIDANDASDRGIGGLLRQACAEHPESYLLWLTGYGDADMLNFFDEHGDRVLPAAAGKAPVGPVIAEVLEAFGVRHFVPFSSMHKYQRADSVWANEYTTPLAAHGQGFASDSADMLPPFVHVDFERDEVYGLAPPENPDTVRQPEEFGDDWSLPLQPGDVGKLRAYFGAVSHLKRFLGSITFRVGGEDHVIEIAPDAHPRAITFETPRASLMTVIDYKVFDDLLIGNFTRATLHGDWGGKRGTDALYPDFTPFVTKFGDNGGARTADELRAYFAAYQQRGFFHLGDTPAGRESLVAIAPYVGPLIEA